MSRNTNLNRKHLVVFLYNRFMWTCSECGRVFRKAKQPHSCQKIPLDKHFRNKDKARDLFEYLETKVKNNIGKSKTTSLPCCIHLSGKYDFLDGVVVSNGCDAMRRLDDCWRKMGGDIADTLPSWFHYFDVPHKPDGHAFVWYVNQVKKLIAAVEEKFDVTISKENLKQAITAQNQLKKLVWELEGLRANDPVSVSGKEAFASLIAATVMPRDLFSKLLSDFIRTVKKRDNSIFKGKRRIFLGGSICDSIELVSLIEDAGAVVVGENVCFGVRNEEGTVNDEDDPIEALTRYYLSGSACPRMFGWYKTRLSSITERIRNTGADGVILQNIRFCDLHGTENGLMERDLEKIGIPSLRIEKEYGPLTETGRLKMRVNAFIEQLESNFHNNQSKMNEGVS